MMCTVSLLSLIFFVCLVLVQGQTGRVIPRACVETTYQTGTVTLAADAAAGARTISVNGAVPPLVSLIINPGGATEERVMYVHRRIDGSNPYTLSMQNHFHNALSDSSFAGGGRGLDYAHSAGETIRFEGLSGLAHFGYNNTGNSTVFIPKGFSGGNYFQPGAPTYQQQIMHFLPGIHDNVFSIPFGGQINDTASWYLNGGVVTFSNMGQGCGTITYQGRLSDANAAANGQYDLRFTVFSALTEGMAQSEALIVENAQVTNGVFTVNLNFGASFYNNPNAKFLEIAVRPGTASGTDPFTLLTPRQPITTVPFAVNAQNATNAGNAASGFNVNGGDLVLNNNMLRMRNADDANHGLLYSYAIEGIEFRGNSGFRWMTGTNGANQRMSLDAAGNLTIGGNLTVSGTITGANNTNFIQNTTTQQANSNFNISGNGRVGGNFGVGAITPNFKLHLLANGQDGIKIQHTGTGEFPQIRWTNDSDALKAAISVDTGMNPQINFHVGGSDRMSIASNGDVNISGTITSGCRAGFTAIARGRLCVSAMQPSATFRAAMETCTSMAARVGNSSDVMLTFSQSGFNYFLTDNPVSSNDPKGWLADIVGDNVRATWNVNGPTSDFDGSPLNIYNGSNGSPPMLTFRCVY